MRETRIITDKEILELEEDLIDFRWFAQTLKRIIISADTPITIGVYGEWGAGKTSIMRLTKKMLEGETKTIWFNAWKYDIALDLRVALLKTILKEMENSESLKEKVSELSRRLDWFGLAKITGSFLIGSPNFDFNKLLKQDEVISLIGEFEERFSELVEDYAGKGPLVIFVDDLDRCLPDKVVDILEAIKLFLDVRGCVFILGLNKEIIEKGIELKYKNIDFDKQNYIEKIIQLPFNIPRLREKEAQEFIDSLAPPRLIAYKNIMVKVGGNPRRIKRVINKFILQTILSEENPQIKIDEEILAKLSVLELRWNKFYIGLIESYDSGSKASKLLAHFRDVCNLSPAKRKNFKEDPAFEYSGFFNDEELLNFLSQEPTLWEIDLEQYIFLRMTSTIDESDIYGKITHLGNKKQINLIKNELVELSLHKLRSNDINMKKIGLAEIKHGWLFVDDINKMQLLEELVKSSGRENNLNFKKEITSVIKELTNTLQ